MCAIAAGLRRVRSLQGKTQLQVAEAIGIHYQAYQRYERGSVSPSGETLIALADFYGVSLDYLVGRSDDPTFTPSAGTIPCSFSKD